MWFVLAMLGNLSWAGADVLSSILVNNYQKNPFVIYWFHSVCVLVYFLIASFFLPLQTDWIGMYVLSGVTMYIAGLIYFFVMHRIDVSILNTSWAFLAIFVSLGSFVFFLEKWTIAQSIGVVLIIGATCLLSFWHKHISVLRTVSLLAVLGLAYAPFFLVQKAALLDGQSIAATFFWPILFAQVLAFSVPLTQNKLRSAIRSASTSVPRSFFTFLAIAVFGHLAGFYLFTEAFEIGLASLVIVTENTQPFITILVAGIMVRLFPNSTPRELLTTQSISVKVVSFTIVFLGLTLLAVPIS